MRKRVLTLAISFILICSLFTSFALAATLRASEYISAYNAVIYSSDLKPNVSFVQLAIAPHRSNPNA